MASVSFPAVERLPVEWRGWCVECVRRQFGSSCAIAAVEAVPTRISEAYRLVIDTPSRPSAVYVKHLTGGADDRAPAVRLAHLVDVLETMQASPDVLPLRVVGCNADHQLVMTEEVAGLPMRTLHRHLLSGRRSVLRTAVHAWHCVGAWLHVLHWQTTGTRQSATRLDELAAYTTERVQRWIACDPRQAAVGAAVLHALAAARLALDDQTAIVTPVHGDVSVDNILVRPGRVGLIDFDDFRLDLPAIDISQALLEIEEFARVGSTLRLPLIRTMLRDAFADGYALPLPAGVEFWLAHLRNLAVFLLTMARERVDATELGRLAGAARYRRTVRAAREAAAALTVMCAHPFAQIDSSFRLRYGSPGGTR